MSFESSRTLGIVGAVLMLIGFIPFSSYVGVIALVGFILILVALHGLGDYYKEGGIFSNALYGFIAGIVGVVVTAAAALYVIFDTSILTNFLHTIYPGWDGKWSSLGGLTANTSNITASNIAPVLGALFAVLVILWVFFIASAVFNRRSLKMLSAKASVGLFSTAGTLLLVGAVLAIVLIGFLLIWIAVLLIAIAFFQMKPQPQQPATPPAPPP